MSDDRIPSIGAYRNVPLHDNQDAQRLALVKSEIDYLHGVTDADILAEYAADPGNSPESRLYAAARVEAIWKLSAAERRTRPTVRLDKLRATTAGLASQRWRCPTHYCSDLCDVTRAVPRELPLDG